MKPLSIPNSSSNTYATGARQFVVQDAAEITLSLGFRSFSFTPKTIFFTPLQGAETITLLAPLFICSEDFSIVLNLPVHSKTTSIPYCRQFIFEISVSLL